MGHVCSPLMLIPSFPPLIIRYVTYLFSDHLIDPDVKGRVRMEEEEDEEAEVVSGDEE